MRAIWSILAVGVACGLTATAGGENLIFSPSPATVQAWVDQGIDAAAREVPLARVRPVNRVVWAEPVDVAPRRLRMLAVLTPQAVATLAGWEAAWEQETWEGIQADRPAAIEKIAQGAIRGRRKGELTLLLVFDRLPSRESGGAVSIYVYGGGRWYYGTPKKTKAMADFADEARPDPPNSEWAARYLAGVQLSANPELRAAEAMTVTLKQDSTPASPPALADTTMVNFLQPGEWFLVVQSGRSYGTLTITPE